MCDELNTPFKALKVHKKSLPEGKGENQEPKKVVLPRIVQNPYEDEDALFLAAMGEKGEKKEKVSGESLIPEASIGEAKLLPDAVKPVSPKKSVGSAGSIDPADENLFLGAMGDVKPLDGHMREAVSAPKAAKGPFSPQKSESVLAPRPVEFHLDCGGTFQYGYVTGLNPKIFLRLKTGKFPLEGRLDLHGQSEDQAKLLLLDFIKQHYTQNRRYLLVITGQGKNSPGGIGILQQQTPMWLTKEPLGRIVLAFVTALPKNGGAGAFYIFLRQFKKSLIL